MEVRPGQRRRPALSCLDCRRRKIKCDRNDPCVNCTSTRRQCKYKRFHREQPSVRRDEGQGESSAGAGSRGSPVRQVPQTLTPAESLALSADAGTHNISTSRPVIATPSVQVPISAPRHDEQCHGGNGAEPLLHGEDPGPRLHARVQRVEEEHLSTKSAPGELPAMAREVVEAHPGQQTSLPNLKDVEDPSKQPLPSGSYGMDAVIKCFVAVSGIGETGQHQPHDPGLTSIYMDTKHLLRECKQVARHLKAWKPSRSLAAPQFDLSLPSREVADALVVLYFRFFESTYRILHEPSFWSEYRRFWEEPEQAPLTTRFKIQLVVAIGSSVDTAGRLDGDCRFMVHRWVHAAQVWLSGPLEKSRLNLSEIQMYCLTILARQVCSVGADLVWASLGSLIHRAMHMKLHRDPKTLQTMSPLLAEQRRRLWATILEMHVQTALDTGMAPRISLDEYDTEPPSNIDDDMINDTATALESKPRDTFTSTSLQLSLLDSLPTRLSILQKLNSLRSNVSYLDVLALSRELTDSCRQHETFFRQNEHHIRLKSFHRNHLRYMIHRFLMPLHFPFTDRAQTNPLFYYSVKASLDAAMVIIHPEPGPHFERLLAVSSGITRVGLRYAVTVVSYALLAQATERRGQARILNHDSQYHQMLLGAISKLTALSIERIKMGETNIKLPVILDMVVANAEAVESGESPERKMAQSAKDRLEACLVMLRSQCQDSVIPVTTDTAGTSPEFVDEDFGADWYLNAFLGAVDFEL